MRSSYFLVLLGFFLEGSIAVADGGTGVPDSFELFENFPHVVAVTDSDNDTIFECMAAERKAFNKEAKTVEMAWLLNGPDDSNRNVITFFIEAGSTPDAFLYRVGSADAPAEVGKFLYTDNESCGISDMPYQGRQCVLWVPKGKEDSVPEDCLNQFSKLCDVPTPRYSKDICKNKAAN